MRQGPARQDVLLQQLRSGRLWWLFLVAALVSLTTLAGMLHQGRSQILLQAKQNVDNLAWVLESRLSSTLQRIDSDMQQMARLLETSMLAQHSALRERARIEALLFDQVAGFPDVLRSTVFDADGALLYSSDPAKDRTLRVANHDAFQRLKTNPRLGTLYSEVVAARGDGPQTVVVARALLASDEHFQGIMFTWLDLDRYQKLIDSFDIGAHGLVSVRRRDDNRLLLSRPQAPADVNRALDTPGWPRAKSGEASGPTHMISQIDQIPRLQSIRTLPDHPFYVTAAFAEADLLAAWRQEVAIVGGLAMALLAGLGRLIAGMDRSERRRNLADQALAHSQRDLRVAAKAFDSQVAMLIADDRFTVIKVNQAYTRVTGCCAQEVIGQDAWFLHSVDSDDATEAAQREALRDAGYWAGEMRGRRKNGQTFEAWLTISAVHADDGGVTHHVAGFTDITEHKAGEERIHALAFYDPLTQLPNRRLLDERLQHAMTVSERNRSQCALLFLDLDHFKLVNDTRGHTVGDSLLVAVAERLRICVRASDTVARRGGDEFVILLEALDADTASAAARAGEVAEKIRLALAEPFVLDGEQYHGSASLGVCLFLGRQIDADELFKRCDTAMYQAKHIGRNALRFFDPAMQQELERRAALDTDLRQATALRQFDLHFQIQVDGHGRAIGAEALLRWKHPVRGLVPPIDFISLAEETGAIVGIGRYVLDAACDRLAAWAADPLTRGLQLAINVSARQFRQADFVDTVRDSLLRSGARATQLELELTETLVMDDVVDTIAKMQALRALGVAFSVDDFGTGYSSLSYLQRLPLDKLKIDKSFVLDLSLDDSCAAIVRSIITLAKVLDLEVVAEGVETEAQRAMLQEMGCNGFQGHLFARPLPLAAFEERLRAVAHDPSPVVTASQGFNAPDRSEVAHRSRPPGAKPAAARRARTALTG